MTPMAARQQKGITAGYVGRPRELNLGRQLGESRCGSCVGKRIRRAMLFCADLLDSGDPTANNLRQF
jgi:hypothetical protein